MEKLLQTSFTSKKKVSSPATRLTGKEKVLFYFATVIVCLGAFTMFFPYVWMFLSSLKSNIENMSTSLIIFPSNPNWNIFTSVFSNSKYNLWMGIKNTLCIEIPVIFIGTIVSSMAAFAFAKLQFRFKKVIFIILMTSMMIPYAAVMMPQYRVWMELGVVDSQEMILGFFPVKLLPMIVPGLFGNISMTFFLVTSMKNSIHNSVIESAKMDGCSYFRMWWQFALPLSKNAIAAQCIFWFVGIWNDYFAPSIYLTGEAKTIQVILSSIISDSESGGKLAEMMACAFITSIPMIIIFLLCRNMFVNSVSLSGVKE